MTSHGGANGGAGVSGAAAAAAAAGGAARVMASGNFPHHDLTPARRQLLEAQRNLTPQQQAAQVSTLY